MARQLQALSWRQRTKNLAAQLFRLHLELVNLIRDIDVIFAGEFADLLDTRF